MTTKTHAILNWVIPFIIVCALVFGGLCLIAPKALWWTKLLVTLILCCIGLLGAMGMDNDEEDIDVMP